MTITMIARASAIALGLMTLIGSATILSGAGVVLFGLMTGYAAFVAIVTRGDRHKRTKTGDWLTVATKDRPPLRRRI